MDLEHCRVTSKDDSPGESKTFCFSERLRTKGIPPPCPPPAWTTGVWLSNIHPRNTELKEVWLGHREPTREVWCAALHYTP